MQLYFFPRNDETSEWDVEFIGTFCSLMSIRFGVKSFILAHFTPILS